MALSREQKQAVVAEVKALFESAKLTAIAEYQGTTVKQMQELRRVAREQQIIVKVVKNRLARIAARQVEQLAELDISDKAGQLVYVFSSQDEVAPAQVVANFAKKNPSLKLVSGVNQDGQVLSADDMKQLASLPSKDQLRAQLIGTINAPLSGFVQVLSGNIRGVLNVLTARAESL